MVPNNDNALVRVAGEQTFGDTSILTLTREGEPLIPVAHVEAALEYAPKKLSNAVRRWEKAGLVREEHTCLIDRRAMADIGPQNEDRSDLDTTGRSDLLTLTERGLYRVLMLSKQPKALEFQDWLETEVLPAIHRTGTFAVPSAPITDTDRALMRLGGTPDAVTAVRLMRVTALNLRKAMVEFVAVAPLEDVASLHAMMCLGPKDLQRYREAVVSGVYRDDFTHEYRTRVRFDRLAQLVAQDLHKLADDDQMRVALFMEARLAGGV